MRARTAGALLTVAGVCSAVALSGAGASANPVPGSISHIVLIYQENHTFDNVLGAWCTQTRRCVGTTTGPTGAPLGTAPDKVTDIGHQPKDQQSALAGNWLKVGKCSRGECLVQFQPSQVPTLTALAGKFGVNDNTFATAPVPSSGAHLLMATDTLDGFSGGNPIGGFAAGWGCQAKFKADWSLTGAPPYKREQMCVPYVDPTTHKQVPAGSPVRHVDSIFDRMATAALPWKVYGSPVSGWDPCSYVADCYFTGQKANIDPKTTDIIRDASAGKLPALSIVAPDASQSQHNGYSMLAGDSWIGSVINAIETGPQWLSTAVMITYDDCGCFYDHVKPPAGVGFRMPFVMVSPWVKPASVDHKLATFDSMLAMIEHAFKLPPLQTADARAYDYSAMFDFRQTPIVAARLAVPPMAKAVGPPVAPNWDPATDS